MKKLITSLALTTALVSGFAVMSVGANAAQSAKPSNPGAFGTNDVRLCGQGQFGDVCGQLVSPIAKSAGASGPGFSGAIETSKHAGCCSDGLPNPPGH
jgi:hypothetical protein